MSFKWQSDGHKLRRARKRMGLSQADVMRAFKLKSTSFISDWENGKKQPSLENAIKLSRLYKTLVQNLFHEIDRNAVKDIAEWMKEKPP